jgi:hypothetical protein
MKREGTSFTISRLFLAIFSFFRTPLLSSLLFLLLSTFHMIGGKRTTASIGLRWRLFPRLGVMRSSPGVMRKMRTSSMMSDLLVGISIALLPFWCPDAKGGEVVLLGFAAGWELVLFAFCSLGLFVRCFG